jgi:hypothetical protein
MLKLIKEKIKFKFPKIQLPLVNQKELTAIIATSRQQSQHAIHRDGDRKRSGSITRQEEAIGFTLIENGKERLQTDAKKSISCKKGEKMRKSINHIDFVQFLAERKRRLQDSEGV